jgi:2-aminoadipate transaminase
MAVEGPPTPSPAARLRGVQSSPVREILALTQRPGVISFAGGLPAPELFDAPGMRAAFAAVLGDDAVGRTLQYSTTEGDPALRAAVAARLTARGLPTHAGELLITSGSQQALTLLATVLLEPGDTVLVEEPSYLAALQAFQLAGAGVVPVPCDDDGLDPEAAGALAARHGARLLYTIPTFQNPTGRTLPLERREALVGLARAGGFWLLEDDPYGELRYHGDPLPPLAALDDRVLSLSTLSKIAAPGLRIGWVRAPEPLRRPLAIAKQAADLHSSTVDQAAAAHWLQAIDLDARVDALRRAYGPRRDALLAGLAAALPPGSTHNRPDGGMFVWARLPDGWDAAALLDRALEREVAFVPGFPFFAGAPDAAALRLSFTTHTPEQIGEGLRRLRAASDAYASAASTRAAAAGIGSASPIVRSGDSGTS